MKKLCFSILFILLLITSGCAAPNDVSSDNIEDSYDDYESIMSETDVFETTPDEPIDEALYTYFEDEPIVLADDFLVPSWMEAYYYALSHYLYFQALLMIDVTFDGIPEILYIATGTRNSWIFSGLSYQNGEIVDIALYDEWRTLGTNISLMQNIYTQEIYWLTQSRNISNAGGFQSHTYYFTDFSDLSRIYNQLIFKHSRQYYTFEEDGDLQVGLNNTLTFPNDVNIDMTFEDFEIFREEFFNDFIQIEVQQKTTHISRITNNSFDDAKRTLNREILFSYFMEWLEICA